MTARPRAARSLAAAAALILLGLPGIAILLAVLSPPQGLPRWALLVQPALLLVVFALAGAFAAPRCGLRSLIAERLSGMPAGGRPVRALALLVLLGAALGLAVSLADHASRPLWQAALAVPPSLVEAWSPTALAFGLLYGGIVEEIVMRWGVMSLVVLGAWRLFARARQRPPPAAVRFGILVAALVFAAAHVPALLATGVAPSPAILARLLFFNGLLGIVFGIVFSRHTLEGAMAAHAGFHLGVAATAALFFLARG